MNEKITIRLNNFLFNAGVIGFIYLLETNVSSDLYTYNGSELVIDKTFFTDESNDLADMYYKACKRRFEDTSKWKNMIELMKQIETLDLSSNQGQERFITLTKSRPGQEFGEFSKLESSSFGTGYLIIKSCFGDDFDCKMEVKKAKKEKEPVAKRELLRNIIAYIEKYPKVLLMKDIMYTKINSIWADNAFLLRANAGKEVLSCYTASFVDPIRKHLSKTKGKNERCIECGQPVAKSDTQGMSWIQSGVDHGRKRSYFWNMNPDSFLCPICAFVYSCAPLGFVFAARSRNAVFINNNASIIDLINYNNGSAQAEFSELNNIGNVVTALTKQLVQKSLYLKTRELDNIQVVIYRNDQYEISIIPKKNLEVIKNCQNSFESLIKVFIKGKDDNIAIYEEVLHNFLFGINQYGLINQLLRYSLESIGFMHHILKIQIYTRGENEMSAQKEYNRVRMMSTHGAKLREEIKKIKNDSVDNAIRGVVYQLLNSLQTRDSHRFFDVITRTYTGYGLPIPPLFINMFENEETFLNLGYAFVFGLKGESYQVKAENNEKGAVANE